VGIDGHRGEPKREEEDAGSSLGADARERTEPRPRIFELHLAQEVEVPALGPLGDGAKAGLDAGGLLLSETTRSDRFDDLLDRGFGDLVP